MRILLHNARVHGSKATAVAVEDGRIVWLGPEDGALQYAAADVVRNLRGAWLAPAFTDSHIHLVQAGFRLTELDLHGTPSLQDCLDRVRAHDHGQDSGAVIVGQGWDETLWSESRPPTGDELEAAAPGARTFVSRIDGHSAVISPALAASVPGLDGLDGWTDDGRVERDAHHAVRTVLGGLVGPDQRLAAARAACAELLRHGVTAFHENAAPHIGPEYELDVVRQAAADAGLHVTAYWGEHLALDSARRLDVSGLAGDLNADGAVGSRTCALTSAYSDAPHEHGHAYLTPEQIAEHVVLCTREGLQAGFHCIGDAALEAIGEGFERAAAQLGDDAVRAARHRLEHVEMPGVTVIATLARLGVTASVQPMFDALWGGPDQMYAERLGERWRGMNPFAAMHAAGVPLAFGSDSPVTPIGPWAAVRAAVEHHDTEQRTAFDVAFDAHTRGGWRAARRDDAGDIAVGQRADLAVWSRTPAGPRGAGDGDPTLLLLVAGGAVVTDSQT